MGSNFGVKKEKKKGEGETLSRSLLVTNISPVYFSFFLLMRGHKPLVKSALCLTHLVAHSIPPFLILLVLVFPFYYTRVCNKANINERGCCYPVNAVVLLLRRLPLTSSKPLIYIMVVDFVPFYLTTR